MAHLALASAAGILHSFGPAKPVPMGLRDPIITEKGRPIGMILMGIAALAAAIWLYLVFARGGFWLCSERHEGGPTTLPSSASSWPSVTVVVPARNEADGIAETVGSLLRQHYAGAFRVILVDDDSSDGTAEIARRSAEELNASDRLQIIDGQPLPRGWTGKLWAVKQGVEAAQSAATPPDYILLSDADIVYAPEVVSALVARAVSDKLVLTSLMVKLRCQSLAERGL